MRRVDSAKGAWKPRGADVRLLCGSPEAYAEWVRLHNDGEDGPNTYEWQVGLPP